MSWAEGVNREGGHLEDVEVKESTWKMWKFII
jgi:hypothetical protein